MSLPTTETLNINPQVDYKGWMDLQFEHLATRPESRQAVAARQLLNGVPLSTASVTPSTSSTRIDRHVGVV